MLTAINIRAGLKVRLLQPCSHRAQYFSRSFMCSMYSKQLPGGKGSKVSMESSFKIKEVFRWQISEHIKKKREKKNEQKTKNIYRLSRSESVEKYLEISSNFCTGSLSGGK